MNEEVKMQKVDPAEMAQLCVKCAEDKLAEEEIFFKHKEGYSDARWILMDYGDVVAHIFLEEERDFYNLEQLWADAPSEAFVENEE